MQYIPGVGTQYESGMCHGGFKIGGLGIGPLLKMGRAIVLGSFQCRGVLLLRHMVGQGPAVLAAGAGRVGCYIFFHLVYPIFFLCLISWETAGHTEILWSRPL